MWRKRMWVMSGNLRAKWLYFTVATNAKGTMSCQKRRARPSLHNGKV
jgi:hypothetical protein